MDRNSLSCSCSTNDTSEPKKTEVPSADPEQGEESLTGQEAGAAITVEELRAAIKAVNKTGDYLARDGSWSLRNAAGVTVENGAFVFRLISGVQISDVEKYKEVLETELTRQIGCPVQITSNFEDLTATITIRHESEDSIDEDENVIDAYALADVQPADCGMDTGAASTVNSMPQPQPELSRHAGCVCTRKGQILNHDAGYANLAEVFTDADNELQPGGDNWKRMVDQLSKRSLYLATCLADIRDVHVSERQVLIDLNIPDVATRSAMITDLTAGTDAIQETFANLFGLNVKATPLPGCLRLDLITDSDDTD